MPGTGETFASFAAMHEVRLVRSVMSESGLSPAAAEQVAADVLPAAHERGFASCGAAYGWLRVAARHRAAGSADWAAAADAALGRADSALAALAGLSAPDRELLRLRYVDGLLPAAIATRLGLATADVVERLDRAGTAARAAAETAAETAALTAAAPLDELVPAPRSRARLSVRAAAAVALVATAVLINGGPAAPSPAPFATAPFPALSVPGVPVVPLAGEPVAPVDRAARPVSAGPRAAAAGPAVTVVALAAPPAAAGAPPSKCRRARRCGDGGFVDELHVAVPKEVGDVAGMGEVVVKDPAGDYVHLCDVFTPVPSGITKCVRRPR